MTLLSRTLLLLTVLLGETALVFGKSQNPYGGYGTNRHDCGASRTDCPSYYSDLPDCCSGYSDDHLYIEWCCDKNVWRYFLYAAGSFAVALFWIVLLIWMKCPGCFDKTWGWIVGCFTCAWIRRNFVNEGTYQTID